MVVIVLILLTWIMHIPQYTGTTDVFTHIPHPDAFEKAWIKFPLLVSKSLTFIWNVIETAVT